MANLKDFIRQKNVGADLAEKFGVSPIRTFTLPEHLGGGQFKTAGPGTLIETKRGSNEAFRTKPPGESEIDHIIPVALGGTSADPNLQELENNTSFINQLFRKSTSLKNRQEGKVVIELEAIRDYQDGKISLPEARLRVLRWRDESPSKFDSSVQKLKQTFSDLGETEEETFVEKARKITRFAEAPSIFKPQDVVKKFLPAVKLGGEIIQSVMRNIASVGATIGETIAPEEQKRFIDPLTSESFKTKTGQEVAKVLLGSDPTESVLDSTAPLGERILKAESILKEWIKKEEEKPESEKVVTIGGKEFETPVSSISRLVKKNPLAFAFAGIVSSAGLDLTGYGGSDDILKASIKKWKNFDEAFRGLKKLGIADDIAKKFAPEAIKATTDAQALKIVDNVMKEVSDVAPKGKVLTKEEFKVGDILDPQGKTNMVGQVKIKEIKGNTLKFVDSEGTEFAGMQRSLVRNLIKGNSWKKVEGVAPKLERLNLSKTLPKEVDQTKTFIIFKDDKWFGAHIGTKETAKELTQKLHNTQKGIFQFDRMAKGVVEEITPVVKGVKEAIPEVAPKIAKGAKERKFVTSIKEKLPDLPKVAGQYVPRSTDDLSIKAKNQIKDDINIAEKLVAEGTDERAVATASELLKHYSQEAEKATSPAIQDAIYDKAAEVANSMARKLTEQGRSVQAASILGRLTPEGQVRFAAREIQKYNEGAKLKNKIPEITKDQTKHIVDEMKRINAMPDGIEKAMKFQELQNYITDITPSSLIDKLSTIWKAGLLTGIKTTGLNIFSNISHFGTEIVKDIPATAVDSVAALFTGQRTKTFRIKGKDGLKEGFGKGLRYLKTGFDERNIAQKLDWKRVNFGKSKVGRVLQKYEESVFRSLGAQDQPFYYGAKARSIADQAGAQAINKGVKGAEKTEFIDNLIKNPTDDMLTNSVREAETAVFQNQTQLGKAAKGLQNLFNGAGNFIVPFGRTPSAVAMQIINYSPTKSLAEIIKLVYNRGKGFDQRAFSQAMGRGLTGTGVLAIGAELFRKGLMTLDYPTGERERELWRIEGKKPNAIKIGNKWRSAYIIGPVGNVLLVGGHFKEKFAESGSPTEAFSKAVAGSAKSFTEQTFLTGLNRFTAALNNPDRSAASFLGGFVGSTVPTIVSDVSRATDTKERRSESILDRIKMRIPGLRETLEPRVTALGEELPRIGNPLEVMFDPTRPTKDTVTPVIAEIRRLTDEGYKVSPTLLGDKKGYEGLTSEQNTDLWKRAGQIINSKLGNLFADDRYMNLDDEAKEKKVNDFVQKSKTVARAEKVLELTEGLQGEELKAKLSELKASKLMTRDVYNKYLEIR